MKITAAVLREAGLPRPYADSKPLELVSLTLEPPGPSDVLVRVRATGLCHSDLSTINGTRLRPVPMVLGHEAAGEVLEVGRDVTHVDVGDHVVMTFVPSCGSCMPCQAGRPALCEPGAAANAAGVLLGGQGRLREGDTPVHHHLGVSGFADHAVVSARSVVRVPPELPFTTAALFGCAVLTGVGAVVNAAQVRAGESVAIFGLGGVGLASLLGAVAAGAEPILVVDRIDSKLRLAKQLGAAHALAASDDVADHIRELTQGGAHHAIETVGNSAVLAQAYAATRRGGTTTTVGLPDPSDELALPALTLTAEERRLQGSYMGSCIPARDISAYVALHRAGRLPVDRLLTDIVAPQDLNSAFDRLAGAEGVRHVVRFDT